jgi:predicted RNA-binding protein with PIN domain
MLFLLDGYNLLFRSGPPAKDFEAKRLQFIEEMEQQADQNGIRMTIVFDAAQTPDLFVRSHYKSVEIVYSSENQSADDYILRLVEHSNRSSRITVVTNDNGLSRRARALGARSEGVEQFLSKLERYQTKEAKCPPKPDRLDQHLLNHYLEIFEDRYRELEDDAP